MSAQVQAPTPVANVPGANVQNAVPQSGMLPPQMMPAHPVDQATAGSLYVGDLNEDVSEAVLFEIFNKVGPVVSIRVCRDSVTRRSLGYAYVNFQYSQDAKRALEELNFTDISGRACRIMWSQRDPLIRRTGANNVFIKNLDTSIDNKTLYDTFVAFGSILSCKVATNEQGQSRGYGFVHFEKEESALAAIEKVNGKMLSDRIVTVTKFLSRKEREAQLGGRKFTNVFVKNLPVSVDSKEKLEEIFSTVGEITSSHLSEASTKSPPRRFGFINYKNPEDAVKAVEEFNKKELEPDCELYVGRAQKKSERERLLKREYKHQQRELDAKNRAGNLYVKHLAEDVQESDLRELFEKFGEIKSLKIMADEAGVSRGFGFVCFDDADSATRAITELFGTNFHGKPLYVALALRKEERMNQLAQERALRGRMMAPGMPFGFNPYLAAGYQQPGGRRNFPGMGPGGMYNNKNMMMPMFAQQPQGMRGGRGGRGRNAGGRGAGRGRGGRQQQAPQQQPVAPQQQQRNDPINTKDLANLDPKEQKQKIGEFLYPKIQAKYGDRAGKITGMLLEMDVSDLLELTSDESLFQTQVTEAYNVLVNFEKTAAQ